MSYFKKLLFISIFVITALAGAQYANAGNAELSGWAWSSGIGWISFNSKDAGAGGGPYSVTLATTTNSDVGTLGGWAWSSSIGWIRFGGLSGFPASSNGMDATINMTTGAISGMARACAGTVNAADPDEPGNCSTMTSRTDGWDGWISLSGTNHASPNTNAADGTSEQGVTLGINPLKPEAYGKLTGFAWGGEVVGWVSFKPLVGIGVRVPTIVDDTCVALGTCPGGNGLICNLSPLSTVIPSGGGATLNWSTNATSCTASGGWSGSKSPTGSFPVAPTNTTTYNLNCVNTATTPTSCSMSSTITVSPEAPSDGLRLFIDEDVTNLSGLLINSPANIKSNLTVRPNSPFALRWISDLSEDYSCDTSITNGGDTYWGTTWDTTFGAGQTTQNLNSGSAPLGEYTFEIICNDSTGVGSNEAASVKLKIIKSSTGEF